MKMIGKTSWRRLAAAVLAASVGLAVAASVVFGGTPTGAPSGPESQAPSPGTGFASTGTRLSDAQIAAVAEAEAGRAGDAAAGSASAQTGMTAVDATLAAAVTASGARAAAPTPAMEALMHSEVVVVVLHGRFTLADAPVKRGDPLPTGSVLTLTIDSHTGWIDARELTNTEPSALAALGHARALGGAPAARTASRVASFVAEVHVNQPETRRYRANPNTPFRTSVPFTVRDGTGRVVRALEVTSGSPFRVRIATGTYTVSAEIGPPVVNPVPRPCGRAQSVRADSTGRGFVKLICTLVG